MRTSCVLFAFVFVACGPPGRRGDDGSGGPCSDGETRCDGTDFEQCRGGVWTGVEGCVDGQSCNPDVGCIDGGCAGEIVGNSYLGCDYLAADLPQWGQSTLGIATIAADQQFAIAVANPWPDPITVRVTRNDAPYGQPPLIAEQATVTVAGDSLQVIPLPQREVDGFKKGTSDSRSMLGNFAYHVTTSHPATVYQFNPQNNPDAYSNDASLLIPYNALDENYVVLGFPGFGGTKTPIKADNRSYITIAAVRPTHVRVVPTTHVMAGDGVTAIPPGQTQVFTLDALQTLTLMGDDFSKFGLTDFSGTRIEADGPLAVWSGVECINVVPEGAQMGCCCDHLEEQLYPRSTLGHDYVVTRSRVRSTGAPEPDVYRIVGVSSTSQVTTNVPGVGSFTLAKGGVRQFEATDSFTVSSTGEVLVGQFMVSQDATDTVSGDPSFILVPPIVQWRDEYRVLVPLGYQTNVLLVSAPAGMPVMVDGIAASCERHAAGSAGGAAYEGLWCEVGEGSHLVSGAQPFGVTIVGWGPGPVSYGYTGGMDFERTGGCIDDTGCAPDEVCSGGECVPPILQ